MEFDLEAAKEALRGATALGGPTEPAGGFEHIDEGDIEARAKRDFRVFLVLLWRHLGLPDPTAIQLSLAHWLQHGPQRSVIMAFRGMAKSWIAGAYCLWLLYVDPQKKVLVASGSLKRAVAFTNWCLAIIRDWPLLHHLRPRMDQRQSSQAFDVGPATPDQSPSFHAAGITSQIVGFRADVIIPDDVETNTNSLSSTMREKIADAVKEFDSILKPGGSIKYLGTPHDEETLYNELIKNRGYSGRVWPVRYPSDEEVTKYGDMLAPIILKGIKEGAAIHSSTEPTRFPEHDLAHREMSLGRVEFALQYMLDTSLSNKDLYALRLSDLIVMGVDPTRAPDTVTWGTSEKLSHLQPLGFSGDYYHAPASTSGSYSKYAEIVGFLDGSGRGTDETALCIVGELNGTLYLLHLWASRDGYGPETLKTVADLMVRFRVNTLEIESNFGDGMLRALLDPYVVKAWEVHNKKTKESEHGGTILVDVRAGMASKESRILSILEPITQAHRLVVHDGVIEWDLKSVRELRVGDEEKRDRYSLFHQYSHLTRAKDSLHHDDRLDALAGACLHFGLDVGVVGRDQEKSLSDKEYEEELERFEEWLSQGETLLGKPSVPKSNRARAAEVSVR